MNATTFEREKTMSPIDLLPPQLQAAARLLAAVIARKVKSERDETKG